MEYNKPKSIVKNFEWHYEKAPENKESNRNTNIDTKNNCNPTQNNN